MRPKITVHADVSINTWVVTFHDDEQVIDLFGTDTLPSSFTLLEDGEVVRRTIEEKNPGALVRIVHRDGRVYDSEDARDRSPRTEGQFEVPESWTAVVEEMRLEGALTLTTAKAVGFSGNACGNPLR